MVAVAKPVFDESLFDDDDDQEGVGLDFETLSRALFTNRLHLKQTLLARHMRVSRRVEEVPQPFQIFVHIAGKKTTTLEVKGSDGVENVKVRPCRLSCRQELMSARVSARSDELSFHGPRTLLAFFCRNIFRSRRAYRTTSSA